MLEFIFRLGHVGFVVDKVALEKVFLKVLRFFLSLSFQRFSILIRLSETDATQS